MRGKKRETRTIRAAGPTEEIHVKEGEKKVQPRVKASE